MNLHNTTSYEDKLKQEDLNKTRYLSHKKITHETPQYKLQTNTENPYKIKIKGRLQLKAK